MAGKSIVYSDKARAKVLAGVDRTLLRVERDYGTFERSFTLPRSVKPEDIEAIYKKGVLVISIPKRPAAGPTKIKVNILDEQPCRWRKGWGRVGYSAAPSQLSPSECSSVADNPIR